MAIGLLTINITTVAVLIWSLVLATRGNDVDNFDFDNVPGQTHEFKFELGAGEEFCFYQHAEAGANVYLSFQVLRGGDRLINFYFYDIDGSLSNRLYDNSEGTAEATALQAGRYIFCFDNASHGFTSKLVYFYLMTMVMHDWSQFFFDLEEVHNLAVNFTNIVSSVDFSINYVMQHQSRTRQNVIRDWYLITNNMTYIGYWSTAQCIVVVLAAIGQVVFLRRMFKTVLVTPTAKPRA